MVPVEGRQALGPGDLNALLDCPPPGEAARARRAAKAPPSRPSPKCFRTCHPPPLHFPLSTWTPNPREDRRAKLGPWTGGRSARARRGPAAPRPLARPASRAAIVPAPPPLAARPPRAPAPTAGRGSRLRGRRQHNNINTAGPTADLAPRHPPHSPGSATNVNRKARRRGPAPSGRSQRPLPSVARGSAIRPASSGLGRSAE